MPPMRLRRNTDLQVLILIALAMFVVRSAGGHLHLCFDGDEPPISVHTLETQSHHEPGSTHVDQDVELPTATLAKHLGQADDSLLLAAFFVGLLLALPSATVSGERRHRAPLLQSLFVPLPPLRGPPAG